MSMRVCTDYYTLSSYMGLYIAQILPDSLLSRWPVVAKFNAVIIDYGRILKVLKLVAFDANPAVQ